jgi:hypothetical protein
MLIRDDLAFGQRRPAICCGAVAPQVAWVSQTACAHSFFENSDITAGWRQIKYRNWNQSIYYKIKGDIRPR